MDLTEYVLEIVLTKNSKNTKVGSLEKYEIIIVAPLHSNVYRTIPLIQGNSYKGQS